MPASEVIIGARTRTESTFDRFCIVNANGGNTTKIESGGPGRSVNMSAADYANIGTNHFSVL